MGKEGRIKTKMGGAGYATGYSFKTGAGSVRALHRDGH